MDLHRDKYPHNALIVVHSITLDRSGEKPIATGGTLICQQPWAIVEAQLSPLAYKYTVE